MGDSQLAIPVEGDELTPELKSIADRAELFARSSKSEATKKAYRSDFAHFTSWCVEHDLSPLPARPETIASYITSLADTDYATSTIGRRMVAISQAHKLTDHESPTTHQTVREVWKGIRRKRGSGQKSKRPLMTVEVRRIVRQLDDGRLIDVRDAALLLVGFAGGLRRSELVGLDVDDLEEREKGIVLHLRQSKTDQEGKGQLVGIPRGRHDETCPVRAVQTWLDVAGIEGGPVFRSVSKGGAVADRHLSGRAVNLVVKRHVESIGLDPDRYGAHSLRSGFATAAARAGASEREIMRHTRHKSRQIVRRYIEECGIFQANAADKLGL